MQNISTVGFVGLGVMGEPICRNVAHKTSVRMVAHDLSRAPLDRLREHGVETANDLATLVTETDLIMLSLPGGSEVEAVISGHDGILENGRAGQIVVDLSTTPVETTRWLAGELAAMGIRFADAPVARTRQAAIEGTLSIMVGADPALFADIRPLLAAAASEISHCGPVGCGQAVKILNNMVLFQTVVALAEALAIGTRSGVDGAVLFKTLAKGSADSFALRNHGIKAMLPGSFPLNAFATDYAIKDAEYALALADEAKVRARGATLARDILKQTSEAGYGAEYWPVLARLVAS